MSLKPMLDLSVIIPFKDHANMTSTCLETLQRFADPVKEVILISNNSSDAELARVKLAAEKFPNSRVVVYNHPFNFHKINNWGVRQATGKVLFFLNNDVELVESSGTLLRAMYDKALQKNVGAVGAVLLYEDQKTIQHGGVYFVPGGTADHLYIGKKLQNVVAALAKKRLRYDIRHDLKVNAVTAAAVMVQKTKFDAIGGFNEKFIIGGGDVDLSLRLNEKGQQAWLIGSSSGVMIHKESRSRSSIGIPYVDFVESYKSYVKHFDLAHGDPFLHWQEVHRG